MTTRGHFPGSTGVESVMAVACLAMLLGGRAQLCAQEPHEGHGNVSFTVGSSVGDGGTALASAVGLGLRWSSRLGIDVELSQARKLDFTIDLCPQPRICVIGGRLPVTGRTLSLVPHLTLHLQPASNRLHLYALAGVGAGHVRQRYFLVPAFFSDERPEFTRTNLTAAVSFGGGATFAVTRRFAGGVDVRFLHLFDDPGDEARSITPSGMLSTIRVGARVLWKF